MIWPSLGDVTTFGTFRTKLICKCLSVLMEKLKAITDLKPDARKHVQQAISRMTDETLEIIGSHDVHKLDLDAQVEFWRLLVHAAA